MSLAKHKHFLSALIACAGFVLFASAGVQNEARMACADVEKLSTDATQFAYSFSGNKIKVKKKELEFSLLDFVTDDSQTFFFYANEADQSFHVLSVLIAINTYQTSGLSPPLKLS